MPCSLVNVLAGRAGRKALVTGTVLVDGVGADQASLRHLSAYVQQEDSLPPTETVYECLMFSAQLRLPQQMSTQQRKQHVDELVVQLVRKP